MPFGFPVSVENSRSGHQRRPQRTPHATSSTAGPRDERLEPGASIRKRRFVVVDRTGFEAIVSLVTLVF